VYTISRSAPLRLRRVIQGMARLGNADPRQLGPYRLLGVLGVGSLGPVYLGRGSPRRGERKSLAGVRAIRPELLRDRQLRARLRHETQTVTAEVNSMYVATAMGCELDSERPWLAYEFVPGPSLAHLVARCGPLPEFSVRALGGALSRSLMGLHSSRIAHRDLRPENVLVGADTPRVVDYCLGLGRMGFNALDGETANPADDVFELGVTLVIAASGHQPFAGSVLPGSREDPDLTNVPEGLCPALLACLHKTPESRPPPNVLMHAFDLADTAETDTVDWLPEAHAAELRSVAKAARGLAGRRLFGR
jgi:serine/threonine protein kinase